MFVYMYAFACGLGAISVKENYSAQVTADKRVIQLIRYIYVYI